MARLPALTAPKIATTRDAVALPAMAIELSREGAEVLAEQATLQLLPSRGPLSLTPEQWTLFASVVVHLQAVRQAFESTIAAPEMAEKGRYILKIPTYAVAGDALRAKFIADLHESMGEEVANAIVASLGTALEGHFGGFGVSMQTLEFMADDTGRESEYRVVRTVTYADHTRGDDRLITRRETHFPGIEDPSGHTWGPFLNVLAAQVAQRSGS